jgi:hypothetical protein
MQHNAASPQAQSPPAAEARMRFLVILEGAAGADTTHAHTLRYLLKYLLRSRSLRCVEARQLTEEGSSS